MKKVVRSNYIDDEHCLMNLKRIQMKLIFLASLVLTISACTTAGPYVTNISSDGANGLTIEKCKVELNAFMGVVSTGTCSTNTLKLTNPNR
jgi:type IV secretion system protein VirB7